MNKQDHEEEDPSENPEPDLDNDYIEDSYPFRY